MLVFFNSAFPFFVRVLPVIVLLKLVPCNFGRDFRVVSAGLCCRGRPKFEFDVAPFGQSC